MNTDSNKTKAIGVKQRWFGTSRSDRNRGELRKPLLPPHRTLDVATSQGGVVLQPNLSPAEIRRTRTS